VDNGSDDQTSVRARSAGAEVIYEPRRGKARGVQTALAEIDSDLVIMVDGDGSYPAEAARILFSAYMERPADMITGVRCAAEEKGAFRALHQFGMSLFATALRIVFNQRVSDLFSGLRLFSRRFYKNVPVLSGGFELEIELTLQAIDKGFSSRDVLTPFRCRAEGSVSKLKTFRDGWRILRFLLLVFRDYKPFACFGTLSVIAFILGSAAGSLPIYEYFTTGFVGRFPLAVLAASLMNVALMLMLVGVLLQCSLRYHREAYQIQVRKFGALPQRSADVAEFRQAML
jgi:glycosyltransferase involved in cell wall biosynthesis